MMDMTDPHTEKHPLTHQAEGTFSGSSERIPWGKGIPMKKERGPVSVNPIRIL